MLPLSAATPGQQPAGSIRGVVTDQDFGTPLAGVQVEVVESGQKTLTAEQGNYVLANVKAGSFTLVFTKDSYQKQVKAGIVVLEGQLAQVDAELTGDFTDMEEFVVEDLQTFGAGSEASLFKLRFDSPSLLDSIGADLMSRAGAGDAASALRLVAGASVQGGKYAVIRGLPDRYVSSQLNGVRMPSADENKRAVELDQFPAAVIESIQVSKTFLPDQQGDASGGAVNLRTKGIPDESQFQIKAQYTYNTQVSGQSDFLSYSGGGFDALGRDDGGRKIQTENIGGNWDGAVGTSEIDAPVNYKLSISGGGTHDLGGGTKLGGYASLFYERESFFTDNAKNDSYWVTTPGGGMVPQTNQGTPASGDFKTALYDVTQGRQSLRLGSFGTLGVQGESSSITLTGLVSRTSTDTATLATDTRGKEYFFPGYDPHDPTGDGNTPGTRGAAPYLRLETLDFVERTTSTLQLNGHHQLSWGGFALGDALKASDPVFDWTLSHSTADMSEPDKRQFGAIWMPRSYNPGAPPFLPPYFTPPTWLPYLPSENFNLGNLQRTWKDIGEDSNQIAAGLTFPFEQWSGNKGSLALGFFDDQLTRDFNQDSFSNFGDAGSSYNSGWDDPWSSHFPNEDHPVTASTYDVDYKGDQHVSAWYGMFDLPLGSMLTLNGGARFETTTIGIVNMPEADATWFPPGSDAPVHLNPGDADVTFSQDDVLPSLGLSFTPAKELTLRAAFSQTVAHQTFKELTPIMQQEFLGGPVFIGNPELAMSALKNYDLRLDYVPHEGGLWSVSWFQKDITDPIEYVQRLAGFTYTTPINYPKGSLSGFEFEVREGLEHLSNALSGLSAGANATFIHSEVTLPASDAAAFSDPGIQAPMNTRDMTNAPDHLYNFFLTYDFPDAGTQVSLFYTVQGDTLVAGAGESLGNFIPSLYAKEYDTLNLSLTHNFGKRLKLGLQAKNLTNPSIEEVYRSDYIGADVTKTSYTKGIEFSLGLSLTF
jgi:TonB-dependent receptor